MSLPACRVLLSAALLLPGARALPCSICSAGDPLVAASDAPSRPGELRLSLEGETLTAEAASDSGPAAREKVAQRTARLVTVYGPTERLNLLVALPWTWKESRLTGPLPESPGARQGLGDAEVGGRWFAWRRTDWGQARRQAIALSMGSSLPTGESNARDAGGRLDDHAQLGTGAWGPYAGVLYRLEQLEWDLFASATGRWRTENRWGFRYGASVTWSVQGQWQPSDRLAIGLGLDGREAARDSLHGAAVENSGGLLLAAAPGVWVAATEAVWISLRAQLPVATALRGDQRVGPVVVAGLQWIAH